MSPEVEQGGPTEGISVYLRVTGKGTVNSEGNAEWSQCCPTRAYKREERGRDTSSTRKHSLETLQRERHLPVNPNFLSILPPVLVRVRLSLSRM